MKLVYFYICITATFLFSCNVLDKKSSTKISEIDSVLIYIDSIKNLEMDKYFDKVKHPSDSTYKNCFYIINKQMSDTKELKPIIMASRTKKMQIKLAKQIFPDLKLDSNDFINNSYIAFNSFNFSDKRLTNKEMAIVPGDASGLKWSSDIYFIKGLNIISKHHNFHRYGVNINSFKDKNGQTVIYYTENFGSGSGIWQYNYFFFKIEREKIVPVLNTLKTGNLAAWTDRDFNLNAEIIKTNPLTLKYKYNITINQHEIVSDSSIVEYRIDKKTGIYNPDFKNKTINKTKLLCYYLTQTDDILFINQYYDELKLILHGNNHDKKKAVIKFIKKNMNIMKE